MQLKDKTYSSVLKGLSIVEVSGESCANCLSLMPILQNYVSKRDDVVLHHIEVGNDTEEMVKYFEITSVPTILVLKDLKVYARCRGYQPEEILDIWLDAKIEEAKNA